MNFAKIASFLMILVLFAAGNPVNQDRMGKRRAARMQHKKQHKMQQLLAKMLIHRRKYENKLIF